MGAFLYLHHVQSTSHILLVRPAASAYNPETAGSNAFQRSLGIDAGIALQKAQQEFDAFAAGLQREGVDVLIVEDTTSPIKPDAVFPNNWITCHQDGRVILYPMNAQSRRPERRRDIVDLLRSRFTVREVIDLSPYEHEGRFLEGTGSMVFDHSFRRAYACLSPRTDYELLLRVCERLKYEPIIFHASDSSGVAIYHTNVMMCIGEAFSIICLESITNGDERAAVTKSLQETGHAIVSITRDQMAHFAGNMLVVINNKGQSLLVCSQQAADALTPEQRVTLSGFAHLVPLAIPTIEALGGGSARCMMSEIFLPPMGSIP